MRLTLSRNGFNQRDGYMVWAHPQESPLGQVLAVIHGDRACFHCVPPLWRCEERGFNKAQCDLTGYTSLRAAILALAHACGYPDAELPEGWTP